MSRVTNFDMSSKGVNLEMVVIRDLDIARMDAMDSFKPLDDRNRKLVWNQFGNYGFDAGDVEEMWKVPEEMTPTDLLMTLKDDVDEEEWMELFEKYFELQETLSFDSVLYDAQDILEGAFEEWKEENLEPQFFEVPVNGYSQGDFHDVIVPFKTLEETPYHPDSKEQWNLNRLKETFRNLLFDAPIWGRLEINDEEIMLDEALSDVYDYDKDEIIQFVKDHEEVAKHPKDRQQYIVEWVIENLPDEPEYI